jgi:peptidoglycan/LPS O-acetylase OafA/YrhL
LIHFSVLTLLFLGARSLHAVTDLTWPALCLMAIVLVVSVSRLVYRLVEVPVLALSRRVLLDRYAVSDETGSPS